MVFEHVFFFENGFLLVFGRGRVGRGRGGKNFPLVLGKGLEGRGYGGENFPLVFGKGLGGKGPVWGKYAERVFGKGLGGKGSHPPTLPPSGEGSLTAGRSNKKAALRAAFLSTNFLPGGICF